jgi:hypothetical protein
MKSAVVMTLLIWKALASAGPAELSCSEGMIQRRQEIDKRPLIAVIEEGFVKSCEFKKTANQDLIDVEFWTLEAGTSKRISDHKKGRLKISTMEWVTGPTLISEKKSP